MRKDKPSLRQIEYFLAVAEHGSIRRAADRLNVSQPTLTAQLARLEALLGIELFERTRTGARLSTPGRYLFPSAQRLMEEFEGLLDAADTAQQGVRGTYRLGVAPTLGPYLLPRLLPALHERYAELKFYIRESPPRALEEGLENGSYDLILTAMPVNVQSLTSVPLIREPVHLVVPREHPLATKDSVTPADLAGVQVLTIEETHQFSRYVERLCERFGAEVLRDYEGTSLDALRVMVVIGMGIAFLPALYIHSEIRDERELVVRELAGESIARMHAIAWRPTSPSRVFFQSLVDDVREILAAELDGLIEVLE